MTNEDLEKVYQNARRLMSLIEGAATEGEAVAASTALQKLLARYHMTMRDVEGHAKDATREEEPDEGTAYESGNGMPRWISTLAMNIGSAYRCHAYLHGYGKDQSIVYFGMPADVETASKVLNVTIAAARNCWKAYSAAARECMESRGYEYKPANFRTAYLCGFADGIGAAYEDQARTDSDVALMVVKPKAVEVAYARKSRRFRTHSYGSYNYNAGARARGRADGYGVGRGNRVTA